MEGVCSPKEPCPHYDGSIDEYERDNFNEAVDQEKIDQSLDNSNQSSEGGASIAQPADL